MSIEANENIVIYTRKNCSQLFLIFTGMGGQMLLMSPFDFLRDSGLATRNLMIFRDPQQLGYIRGISDDIPSLDSLGDLLERFLANHPHIEEVYCIGVSAGAIAAMLLGHRLRARTVWSFSARSPSELWKQRYGSQSGREPTFKQKVKRRLRVANEKCRRLLNIEAKERLNESLIDVDSIRQAARDLMQPNGCSEYRLFYATSNPTDTFIHQQFVDCPGVVSFPVVPPNSYTDRYKPGWDHMILPILQSEGKLGELFPAFADASS